MKNSSPNLAGCGSIRLLLSILPIALTLFSQSASGSTYYVSVYGSDFNSGDASAPFRRLSKAASAARQPGDTVIVMDGTYDNEFVTAPGYVVDLAYSGAPGNPITFKAQNRGRAILDAGNTTTGTSCNGAAAYFNLHSTAYIVIQGFVIQRGCDEGIHSNDSAHDITIRWNEVRYIANRYVADQYGRDGIYINSSQYNFTFDGNLFHDIGRTNTNHFDHGIYIHGSNHTIVNNVFYNMSSGWAIQMADGLANTLVSNNTFVNANGMEGGQIMMWNRLSNITIQNNIFYNARTYGIVSYAASVSSCSVSSNIVYGASGMMQDSSGCSQSANQIGVNPMFMNLSGYDFHLQSFGPAVGTGIPTGAVYADFDGTARSGGMDIGAYQHGGAPVSAPPVTVPYVPPAPVAAPYVPPPVVAPPPVSTAFAILTPSLRPATSGVSYSQQLIASAPATWAVIGGALPPGLRLDPASGMISGVPAGIGSWGFIVQASSSQGSDTKSLFLMAMQ